MASRSLNRATLIGNLTRDPELKYTPQGTAICSFGVATNRSWVTATGEMKEDVQYHRIVAWQRLAELCGKILAKGKKIYLEGRLTYRTYVGKDGVQRTMTEIVLDDFVLLSQPQSANYQSINDTGQNAVRPQPAAPAETRIVEDTTEATTADSAETAKKQEETDNQGLSEEKIDPEDIPF